MHGSFQADFPHFVPSAAELGDIGDTPTCHGRQKVACHFESGYSSPQNPRNRNRHERDPTNSSTMSKDFKAPEGMPKLAVRRHSKESVELGPPERLVVSNAKQKELQQKIVRLISKVDLQQDEGASEGETKAVASTSRGEGSKQRSSLGKQHSEEEIEDLIQDLEKRCRLKAQRDIGGSLPYLKANHPVLLHFLTKHRSNTSLLDLFVDQLLTSIERHTKAAQPEKSTAIMTDASESVFSCWMEVVAAI